MEKQINDGRDSLRNILAQEQEVLESMLAGIQGRVPRPEGEDLAKVIADQKFREVAESDSQSFEACVIRFIDLVNSLDERMEHVKGFRPREEDIERGEYRTTASVDGCTFKVSGGFRDFGCQVANIIFSFADGVEVSLPLSIGNLAETRTEDILDIDNSYLNPYIGDNYLGVSTEIDGEIRFYANDQFDFDGSRYRIIDEKGLELLKPLAAVMIDKARDLLA